VPLGRACRQGGLDGHVQPSIASSQLLSLQGEGRVRVRPPWMSSCERTLPTLTVAIEIVSRRLRPRRRVVLGVGAIQVGLVRVGPAEQRREHVTHRASAQAESTRDNRRDKESAHATILGLLEKRGIPCIKIIGSQAIPTCGTGGRYALASSILVRRMAGQPEHPCQLAPGNHSWPIAF
jgi:hypothetical protein